MNLPSDIRSLCLAAAAAFIFLAVAGVAGAVGSVPDGGKTWLKSEPSASLDLSVLDRHPVTPARAARCATLFFVSSIFESRLNRLARLRNIYEVISFYRRGPAPLPMLTEVQELRLMPVAEELWLLHVQEPKIGLGSPLEAFLIDPFDTKAAIWELNLPCFATEYDRSVNHLRRGFALWEDESITSMAQTLEGLDEIAFQAAVDQVFWKRLRPKFGMCCD